MSDHKRKYQIFHEGNDIIFLTYVPPDELDEDVIVSFKAEVKNRKLEDVIFPNVEELIHNAVPGEPVMIGGMHLAQPAVQSEPLPVEEKIEVDPETIPFKVEVSKDGLQAHLRIDNPIGNVSSEHVKFALDRAGISSGIIDENIKEFLSNWPREAHILVAEGRPPLDGEDAEVETIKMIKNDLVPEVGEDGQADFKHLNLISPVEAGELLQTRIPPTQGEPGIDVFGKVKKSKPGKDARLKKGANTIINDENTELRAVTGGFIHRGAQGTIDVHPVYTVKKNVDYHTGNIEYNADVLVNGDVRAGFSVISGGDVHIKGAVEDAIIEAEGNVIINGGVVSSGEALIKAGGDVSVGFLQHATIECGGSVFIKIASMGSNIRAHRDVEVMGREGRIYGGDIEVGGWVDAQIIGCESCDTLKIKFHGMDGIWDDPNDRYKYSFVSTQMLESPVRVVFGSRIHTVPAAHKEITVLFDEKRIVTERNFINPDSLNKLREERELMESKSGK